MRQEEEADILDYLAKFGKIVNWQQRSVVPVLKDSACKCDAKVARQNNTLRLKQIAEENITEPFQEAFFKSNIRMKKRSSINELATRIHSWNRRWTPQ
ncbi:hypothetical protein pipiens_019042 [Culex pipiens pipiens]|uniref:Uncharacterized protein n=1 Tax=Culex pipiens pipiens TaxID=38569 RepID=A0ABD1DYG9_CULPP